MKVSTGKRELESARRLVSQAELEALNEAEQLRLEAQRILDDAKAEAGRIVEQAGREADKAAETLRRGLVHPLLGLRDALVRADEIFEHFLQAVAEQPGR